MTDLDPFAVTRSPDPDAVPADPARWEVSANTRKLEARLRGQVGKAIADFDMISAGDRIMVCLSGGKDSYVMLDMLLSLRRNAPVDFELVAINLDQKQPGFPEHVLPQYLRARGVPYDIIEQDTYSVVKRVVPEGRTLCGLCSRLRRGALYTHAARHGFTKIALGHHRDDIVETFFLNLFHGGRLKSMPAKLLSEDGRHIVIRPLAYCRERDIARLARARAYPIIPCNLCGSQSHLQRQVVKEMLAGWERRWPNRTDVIFRALQHADPSQLLDRSLFDFANLEDRRASAAMDTDSGADLGPERFGCELPRVSGHPAIPVRLAVPPGHTGGDD